LVDRLYKMSLNEPLGLDIAGEGKPFIKKPRDKDWSGTTLPWMSIGYEVNDELLALRELLKSSGELLKSGARLVVISYHSLEDRLVKNYFERGGFDSETVKDMYGNPQLIFRSINKKPIMAGEEEVARNRRARGAKMRIAEKI